LREKDLEPLLDVRSEIEGIEVLDPRGFWEMHRQ
jgi:hypothetical protein